MTEQEINERFPYVARKEKKKVQRFDLEPYEFEISNKLVVTLSACLIISIAIVTFLARHFNWN